MNKCQALGRMSTILAFRSGWEAGPSIPLIPGTSVQAAEVNICKGVVVVGTVGLIQAKLR